MAKVDLPPLNPSPNQYPGNSYTQRDAKDIVQKAAKPERRAQTITQGTRRKTSLLQKFTRYIFEDTVESARDHTIDDIIKPGIKSLLFDTGLAALSILIYGDVDAGFRGSPRRSIGYGRSHTSYNSYWNGVSNKKSNTANDEMEYHNPDGIIVDSVMKAQETLRELDRLIHEYGQASIADLYDCVEMTSSWPDYSYGWTSMRGAKWRKVREGVEIIMPPTHILKD